MGFADFSISKLYTEIITNLNTQLTSVGKLFKNQTTGDFVDQVRYNSTLKRFEAWSGTAWAAIDLTGTGIAAASIASGTITANLTGNVTGNVTGSSGSCTGNAASATTSGSCTGNAASATTSGSCAGNAATATNADQLDSQHGAYYLNRANHTGELPAAGYISGSIIGLASATNSAYSTLTSVVPLDDTIPQVGEMTSVVSVAYAAKKANSLIRIRAYAIGFMGGNTHLIAAIFQNGSADALAVNPFIGQTNNACSPQAECTFSPGSTASVTYSFALAVGAPTTFYLNTVVGTARKFGGRANTIIFVEEVAQ